MMLKATVMIIGLLLITGCGGVDIGSIPITAGDIDLDLNDFLNGNTLTVGNGASMGTQPDTDLEADEDDDEVDEFFSAYDLHFEAVPHSGVPLFLTVIDPNGYRNYAPQNEPVAWPLGTAWEGLYTINVRAGHNYNNANERASFTVRVYMDGVLAVEIDDFVQEGSDWEFPTSYPSQ